ncbi:hypothetical protein PV326_012973 [Microctonus aethiopoides]|uniref:RING-type domain-containing protein n=1 Tax=Microctonus aethiopoides TaxID=144406 RepID=A0AA39FP49_9HYME|nr:hypothetical protein PV326_012973 [Microctonus aethiopoides]KAK0173227.1 hypothetical protein PV328_006458 [Microctonus aethiopoides]
MDITLEEESSSQSFSEDNYTGCFLDSSSNSDDFDDYGEREPEPCFRQTYYSSDESAPSESEQENTSTDNTCSSHDDESDSNIIRTEDEEESIEMLEENNNDPNNNMENENSDSQEFIAMVQAPISPQPGCSKDADIECNSNELEINSIADRIMKQISKITHESIVIALNKAKNEGNNKQISLHDLLSVSQVESNHSDVDSLNVKNIDKPNEPMIESTSSMKAELFNKNVFIDLTTAIDDPVVNDKPAVILNETTGNDCGRILSPRSRTPISNNSLDSSIESTSKSDDNYNVEAKISKIIHEKPIVKLPEPEAHNRKVHVGGIRSDIIGISKGLDSLPLKSKLTDKLETNINSKLVPNIYRINEPNEVTKNNKGKQILNATNRKYHDDTTIVYKHQPPKLVGSIKVIPHSNAPATVTSNDYKRKHIDSSLPKSSVNVLNLEQLARTRQDFIPSLISISKPTVNINNIKMSNQNPKRFANSSGFHVHNDKPIQKTELKVNVGPVNIHRCKVNAQTLQMPSTIKVPRNNPMQQCARVVNQMIGMFDIPTSGPQFAPPQSRRLLDIIPPVQLQRPIDYHDLTQPGPSQCDVESTASISSEIYNKLRAMFPNLNRDYIKKFCPSRLEMDRDVQLSNIVDRMLMEEPLWEYDIDAEQIIHDTGVDNINNINNVPNVEETCEYLAGIFPDADPHYLRQKAIMFKDENEVKTFVDQQLQNPDYPTREQYLAKLKITEEQKRYTTNFVVADFVKIFPDPFSYFENPNRICKHNIVCSEFLKAMFNRIRVHTISHIYAVSKYNMSLAAKRLKLSVEEMKSRRGSREIPTADIPILQEIAFIRHQDEIRSYINETQLKERNEFQTLKMQGKLLVCQCCYDDECMPSKCSTCENGHNFCNSCIITGTDSKLGDGEAHVPCFMACGSEFSLSTLQNILLPTKFSILLKKRQAAEVMAAGLEGLVSCPFCHFASIPPEGDKVFKCLNPECMKESCIKCKEPNHVPLRCDEVSKADKARKYIEEKMTQALARTCYKCKRSFFKEEGCNKITCPCGAIMCYLCDKPIKDYSHFAGQGSNEKNKCPLWTDNQRVNAETVRKVAEVARSELLREDPTLIINTDKLAPDLPPPTSGPHNQIHGADNIAVQLAARVMKEHRR